MQESEKNNSGSEAIDTLLRGISDLEGLGSSVTGHLQQVLKIDFHINLFLKERLPNISINFSVPHIFADLSISGNSLVDLQGYPIALPFFWDFNQPLTASNFVKTHVKSGTVAFCILPLVVEEQLIGWLGGQTKQEGFAWKQSDKFFLEDIARATSKRLTELMSDLSARDSNILTDHKDTDSSVSQFGDDAPWVIFDLSQDGLIEYVSSKVDRITGLDRANIHSKSIFDVLNELLLDVYKAEAFRKLRKVLKGAEAKARFFAESINPLSGDRKQFQFQAEMGRPGSGRSVLILTDVSRSRMYREKLDEAKLRSIRLVEYGNLIIIRTDLQLRIIDVLGDTERILGVPSDLLLHDDTVWNLLLATSDFRALAQTIRSMGSEPHELSREIRVVNQKTRKQHWLLLTAVPLFSSSGDFIGWEGFGLDISEKRETEERLFRQSKRIEALYAVSKAVQGNMDPALVALSGLKALVRATTSDSGFCVLYDRRSKQLELVATVGCSEEYVESLVGILNKESLIKRVVESKKGFFTNEMNQVSSKRYGIAVSEGIKSAMFVPLMLNDPDEGLVVVGCLQVGSKNSRRYTDADYELVQAASGQISLVIRQAEYYEAERREASSLAILYRLSHNLSKAHTPRDVATETFATLQREISCKRIWFGVVNEAGTHLEGFGGVGPGMRDQVGKLQIELQLPHDFLDEALDTMRPVVIQPGASMECSGLNSLMRRLDVGTVLVIPLVALGNVVGVILVEPNIASSEYIKRKLPLLASMANEIGAVVLTRKLEDRIVRAEKMRMASLLASGVAHNFNNLLQAVMGQASLIEMQLPVQSPLRPAAKTITNAAARGAELIKHMLSVSQHGDLTKRNFSLSELLEQLRDVGESVLGRDVTLSVKLPSDSVSILGDRNQLMQVIKNILVNAKESFREGVAPEVSIISEEVRLRSGEVDPHLPPGQYVRIDIADNGVGMDPETQARCFEPFFSTKNVDLQTGLAFDGAGFGLALGYSIMRQHDGLLSVSSTEGEGSIFSIFLPLGGGKAEQSFERDSEVVTSDPSYGKRLQALLIAIEDSSQFTLKSALESLGFAAKVLSDQHKAIEYAKSHKEAVDLLLVDLDRIEEVTVGSLRALKQGMPRLHVLAVTRDSERWQKVFAGFPNFEVAASPLGVWAIQRVVRKVVGSSRAMNVESESYKNETEEVASIQEFDHVKEKNAKL